jgi:short-subunit dehydrogenase
MNPLRWGDQFNWAGRRTLITGGSSGIGKHLASELLLRGARVGIVSNDADKLRAAEAELKQLSPDVWSHPCDVSVLDDVQEMARAYRDRFDAPDVLVNNAGYAVYQTFEQTRPEEIHRLFDVNLAGAALVTREFLPGMIRAGGGHIVMMASIAGRIPMTPCGVYSASKHGLVALAELLQIEIARFHVRIHVVCPGRVETDFFSHESFKVRAHRPESTRTIPIESVTRAVIDAVSGNRFMTYVPRYYGLLAWFAAAMPLLFRPLWHRLMASRVESAYAKSAGGRFDQG